MYKLIGSDGQQYGPVSAEQLRGWIAENRVNAQSLVLPEGAPDWKQIGSLPEFSGDFRSSPPHSVPPPLSPPMPPRVGRASNRIPAGICGILLGAFGVHKFILGYTGAGLIMLLVTLLTCFIAYPVMHLFGLIEGIIYLARTDEEFVRDYVDRRHEWF